MFRPVAFVVAASLVLPCIPALAQERPEPLAAKSLSAVFIDGKWTAESDRCKIETSDASAKGSPKSLHFAVRIQQRTADGKLSLSWPACRLDLASAQDWSAWDALGFWVYGEKSGSNPLVPFRVSIQGADGKWAETVLRGPLAGKWAYCRLPLAGRSVTGIRAVRLAVGDEDFANSGDLSLYLSGFEALKLKPTVPPDTVTRLEAAIGGPPPQHVTLDAGQFRIPFRLRLANGKQTGFDGRETIRIDFREIASGYQGSVERPVGTLLQPGQTIGMDMPLTQEDIGSIPGCYEVTFDLHRGAASLTGGQPATACFRLRPVLARKE